VSPGPSSCCASRVRTRDTAREKVAALLIRVRMERDEVVLTVAHVGDHRLRPDGQQVEGHAEGVSLLGCGGCDDVDHDLISMVQMMVMDIKCLLSLLA